MRIFYIENIEAKPVRPYYVITKFVHKQRYNEVAV